MLPLVDQIYVVAAVVGFLFLTVGFVIGQMEHGGDHGDFGDGGDGGDFGGADSDAGGDFSGADSDAGGDFGGADSDAGGDFGGADSDAGGDVGGADSDAGGDFSGADSNTAHQLAAGARANAAMRSGAGLHDKNERSMLLTVLKYLSPTTIATFLFCFGFAGIMFSRGLPFLGWLSLIPALIGGIIIHKLISRLLARITRSLHTSSNFREESLIGRMAETTCSIPYGRMGEITYKIGAIRHTAPARSYKEGVDISKTASVIISDIQDGVFYVEPSEAIE
jgi:hypothetical protein